LIEGVAKGEAPDLSTIWTMVGFPNTSICLPVWLKGGKNLPEVLVADGELNCELNQMAMKLKDRCYPIKRSAGYKYLNVSELVNREGTGIIQQLEAIEKQVFSNTEEKLSEWHRSGCNKKDIEAYYQWLDQVTKETYETL
jgi:hypothetical protein